MEIKLRQKVRLQIQQYHVTKIILFLFFTFVSCGTKEVVKNKIFNADVYEIINNELNDFIPKVKMEQVFLEKQFQNNIIENINELKFDENNYEYHFLTTFYSLEKEEFKYIFNENQISFYKNQLNNRKEIDPSKIISSKVKIIDSIKNGDDASSYFETGLIIFSIPVFSENNKYAIINYYYGDYFRNGGNEGITVYKKINDNWFLYKRISLGIS